MPSVEFDLRRLEPGQAPDQARLAARRAFGGIEQMKEAYRDGRGLRWLDDVRRDVHQALRALRRAPVFTGAAILTLAVGLTAVTGIFAVLNAFMLRAMPVSHPEQLVSIGTAPDAHVQIPHGVSFVDLQDYRKDHDSFEDLLAYSVAKRTREFGVRIALGAAPGEVRRLVLRGVMWLTAIGGVLGVGAALVLGRAIESLLYEMKSRDPLVFAGAVGVLVLVALLAGLIPAWRASRIAPMVALRAE